MNNTTHCVPCIRCGKVLPSDTNEITHPYGGNFGIIPGNYGSSNYDPIFGLEQLEFVICDSCLCTVRDEQKIVQTFVGRPLMTDVPIGQDKYIKSIVGSIQFEKSFTQIWTGEESYLETPFYVPRDALEDFAKDNPKVKFHAGMTLELILYEP